MIWTTRRSEEPLDFVRSRRRNYEEMRRRLAEVGLGSQEALDLWTAVMSGLADQQIANDPGGERWRRLTDRAVDMYLDHMGVLSVQQGERT